MQAGPADGPDRILAFGPATGERTPLLRDETVDPARVLYAVGGSTPIGAMYRGAGSRTAFFDEKSADAVLYRKLEAAFPGQEVFITSRTDDGALALVEVAGNRNPGDFYVFDTNAGKAAYLLSRGDWFHPDNMAPTRAIALEASDGTALHGYLHTSQGTPQQDLPLVVRPHGGTFGLFSTHRTLKGAGWGQRL